MGQKTKAPGEKFYRRKSNLSLSRFNLDDILEVADSNLLLCIF